MKEDQKTTNVGPSGIVYPGKFTSARDPFVPADQWLPSRTGPKADWVWMTPELALDLVENHMPHNRSLRQYNVNRFVRDINNGEFVPNGETIKVDKHGNLIDGQHRAWAIALGKKPVLVLIVSGLDPDVVDTIDAGIARSLSDLLKMDGKPNGNVRAAIISLLNAFLQHGFARSLYGGSANELRPTHKEGLFLHERFESEIDLGVERLKRAQTAGLTGNAAWGFTSMAFDLVDEDLAETFFNQAIGGIGLEADNPVLLLRQRIYRERAKAGKKGVDQFTVLYILVRIWNAYYDREHLTKFQMGTRIPTIRGLEWHEAYNIDDLEGTVDSDE